MKSAKYVVHLRIQSQLILEEEKELVLVNWEDRRILFIFDWRQLKIGLETIEDEECTHIGYHSSCYCYGVLNPWLFFYSITKTFIFCFTCYCIGCLIHRHFHRIIYIIRANSMDIPKNSYNSANCNFNNIH